MTQEAAFRIQNKSREVILPARFVCGVTSWSGHDIPFPKTS